MTETTLPVPFEGHLHVRDGDRLAAVVLFSARQFGYGIIMPNLAPKHVTTVAEVRSYLKRILHSLPRDADFTPLMTVSVAQSSKKDLCETMACEDVHAGKLYAGHTTNAEGVEDIREYGWAFELMEKAGKPLLLHGEAPAAIDVFDREQRFYETSGRWIVDTFPGLKIVCEHITTKFLADFVEHARLNVAATITPQHLLANRNDMLGKGGIRPHFYCMPIHKRAEDQRALLTAATSGNPKFFLGTDSAPHPKNGLPGRAKESACGCAGTFTATHALELYAEAFYQEKKLQALPAFATAGHKFYGLAPKPGSVTIREVEPWQLPESFEFGEGNEVVPFHPRDDRMLRWKVTRSAS